MPVTTLKPIRYTNNLSFNGVDQWFPSQRDYAVPGYKIGEKVTGWRKIIKDGGNAGSPYVVDRSFLIGESPASPNVAIEYWVWNGSSFVVVDTISAAYNGYGTNTGELGNSFILGHGLNVSASDEAQALTKIYSRIRQESYGVNGLLVLGELRETIHMIRHPLESVRKGVTKYLDVLKAERLKVQKFRQRKSETSVDFGRRKAHIVKDAMSGSWLELQFGIKPAISDVKEIVSTALDILTGEPKRARVSGTSKTEPYVLNESSRQQKYICVNMDKVFNKISHASVRYVVGLKHTLDGPGTLLNQTKERMGFQVQNFIPTIYELIPYSFLLDYFVNLGDIVEASCTDTSAVSWVSKTVRQDTISTVTESWSTYHESFTTGTWHPQGMHGKTDSFRVYRHLTVTRSVGSTLGIPPLILSVPGIDSTKWKNMAALLVSARDFRFRR
jgi:hypothetical protein